MLHLHNTKYLPSIQAIQSVSAYREQLDNTNIDFKKLLISLKETVYKHNFMIEQDNFQWASTRGVDYFSNPKLFEQAPLSYVCAFISEVFKNFSIEEINKRLPKAVLQQALSRLAFFSR